MSNEANRLHSERPLFPLLDIEDILPILNEIFIFAGLSDKQLYTLFRLLKKARYSAGKKVFEQGERPSHIHIVWRGGVKWVVSAAKGLLNSLSSRKANASVRPR